MSNFSNHSQHSPILSYSSSSNNLQHPHQDKINHSLHYLDQVRKINSKLSSNNQPSLISPFDKLLNANHEFTYIDQHQIYCIVKVQTLQKLKSQIAELQKSQQSHALQTHTLINQNLTLRHQLTSSTNNQSHLSQLTQSLKTNLQYQKNLKLSAQERLAKFTTQFCDLADKKLQDQTLSLNLKSQIQNLKAKIQINKEKHQIICEIQTQYYIPAITITPFQPNLQQILKKLRQKQGQKVSRQTLKEVVSQSLDVFLKQLDAQYKLIQQQTLDLNNLRQKNESLIDENKQLMKNLQEKNIEQQKLKIFRNCMTQFLNDTSENVNKSIESQRIRKRIYEQLSESDRNVLAEAMVREGLKEGQGRRQMSQQMKELKQNTQFLKRENLNLLKALGEYQYKWKNIEKVLDQKNKEQISDEGTVGQLVKMSRLVKQSIKSLLQEI